MSSKVPFPFLSLPRELRDTVYRYYVSEGHYYFDYDSGKLRTPHGPVNIAFTCTCRQVADEMRGLALSSNTIIFSTVYSKSERKRAGIFDAFITKVYRAKSFLFKATGSFDWRRRFMTQEILVELAERWPQFIPAGILCDKWNDHRASQAVHQPYGARSEFHAFLDHAVGLLSANPDFVTEMSKRSLRNRSIDPSDAFLRHVDPWIILTETNFTEMDRDGLLTKVKPHSDDLRGRIKFRYSAAAAATNFLRSLPANTRKSIQHIILDEDHEAVAFPSCHARGLIPFCLENPALRFERRVNLWRNALPSANGCPDSHDRLSTLTEYLGGELEEQNGEVPSWWATQAVAPWIEEVLALPQAGMPPNSFSLVFDGHPAPDQSSEIFQVVLRDAAWQSAAQKFCQEKSLDIRPRVLHVRGLFIFDTFPQVISDIVKGQSCITCNFPLEDWWDSDEIYEENKDLSFWEWGEKHAALPPRTFQTARPLPPWLDLQLEILIPKQEYHVEMKEERLAEARARKPGKERALKQAKGRSREMAKGRSRKARDQFENF